MWLKRTNSIIVLWLVFHFAMSHFDNFRVVSHENVVVVGKLRSNRFVFRAIVTVLKQFKVRKDWCEFFRKVSGVRLNILNIACTCNCCYCSIAIIRRRVKRKFGVLSKWRRVFATRRAVTPALPFAPCIAAIRGREPRASRPCWEPFSPWTAQLTEPARRVAPVSFAPDLFACPVTSSVDVVTPRRGTATPPSVAFSFVARVQSVLREKRLICTRM